ncbi:MAG: ATP-dependent Clp protease adaptor ClpS [Nitrospirae bacterium]|nr:ATP-dependent Clp protease adaptor ClpS [Nitrospirota bacterium]MBI3594786.1 ATP-dependent Clp protease adaptor ClpS [Nitrospirota bacterium]
MAKDPGVLFEEQVESEIRLDSPWNVILYNDDVHSFEEVILQVQKATGVTIERAIEITLEAHQKGRAICFSGPIEKCTRVANTLKEIRLHVEIDQPATL